jgi:hypothetical protein
MGDFAERLHCIPVLCDLFVELVRPSGIILHILFLDDFEVEIYTYCQNHKT